MKFFEKLILIEKRKRRGEALSDDEIERDQADREEDDAEAEDEEEAETGQAVEMAEPGDVINGSKKTKKKAKKEDASPMDKSMVKDSPFTVDGDGEEEEDDDTQEEGKDWIQKAVNPKHKGYCTPMTKETCTPARKALAKRFKKAGRKEKKAGGTGWEGKV